LDFDEEFTKFKAAGVSKSFKLPDGNVIKKASVFEPLKFCDNLVLLVLSCLELIT
jgi:hypothetical protein